MSGERAGIRMVVVCAGALFLILPWIEMRGWGSAEIALSALAGTLALLVVGVALARAGTTLPAGSGWLLALPVGMVLASALAPYRYAAFLAVWREAAAVALALACGAVVGDHEGGSGRLRIARAGLLAGAVAAVAALTEVLMGGGRGRAGFVNPNHLGAFLAALVPLALAVSWPGRGRRLGVGLAILLGLGAIATGSRGAMLALGVALVVVLVPTWRSAEPRRRLLRLAVGMAVMLLSAGALALRFSGGTDLYRFDRLRIWPASITLLEAAPLLGIGPGQFSARAAAHNFPRAAEAVQYGRVFRSPHSHLLLRLVETGVAGLLLLALGLAMALVRARAVWRSRPADELSGLAAGAAAGLSAFAVTSLFDEPAVGLAGLTAVALLVALALPPAPFLARAARSTLRRAALPALALAWLAGIALPALAQGALRAAAEADDRARRATWQQRAARLAPGNAYAHGELAEHLLRHAAAPLDLVSYGRIRELAERAVALHPWEPGFELTLARLERRACIETFREALSCGRAVRHYAAVAALAPTDPRPRREAASLARLLGEDRRAAALLEEAVALEPSYAAAWADLAAAREELGDRPAAERARAGFQTARQRATGVIADSPYARDILAGPEPPAARR